MDSNLLKEAIADAKAVRATALANAKVALEEQFTSNFHAMFAEKLKEEAGNDDLPPPPPLPNQMYETDDQISESEIDELIAELENEVGDEEMPQDPNQDPNADVDLNMGDEAPDMGDEAPDMGDEAPDMGDEAPEALAVGAPIPAGVPVIIQPVDQAGAGAGAPVPPVPFDGMGDDAPDMGDDMGDVDEDVDLEELLENLRNEMESDEDEECPVDENLNSSSIGGKVGGSDNKKPSANASATSRIESAGKDRVGGGEGYKSGPADPTTAKRPNSKGDIQNTPKLAKEAVETGVTVTAKEPTEAKRPNQGPVTKTDMSTAALTKENAVLKRQLGEATETVTFIKGQLNEINLLNAKLLYTNKLFKEFSMNNEQKMRVVEMFDLSKNVREVKLTYATIAESVNFSGNMKKQVRKTNASVQSITEGIASRPVASTKPTNKGIILESDMVSKFQKLAGIKKK